MRSRRRGAPFVSLPGWRPLWETRPLWGGRRSGGSGPARFGSGGCGVHDDASAAAVTTRYNSAGCCENARGPRLSGT